MLTELGWHVRFSNRRQISPETDRIDNKQCEQSTSAYNT